VRPIGQPPSLDLLLTKGTRGSELAFNNFHLCIGVLLELHLPVRVLLKPLLLVGVLLKLHRPVEVLLKLQLLVGVLLKLLLLIGVLLKLHGAAPEIHFENQKTG
jgi:hypothetical protein